MPETKTQTDASPFRVDSRTQPNFISGQPYEPQTPAKLPDATSVETPLIDVNYLNVTYNKGKSNEVKALENINLKINPREYVIIFGPSGCGKSTLLYTISALQKPTSGDIAVGGEITSSFNRKQVAKFHQRKIGMIFQSFYLIPSLNVIDNVILPKVFTGEDSETRRRMAEVLLDRFGIVDQKEKFPSELSGGQKQRVSIARSLINNPEIILADEPVGNLDSKSAHNVMSILDELNKTDKKTVILVTHDPDHLQFGDKIVHMKDGKIIKIEIVKKRAALLDSYIFKDGKVSPELKNELIREEEIPDDLRLLMKAFKNLSPSQVGSMMIPFKSKQLFSHIFFNMTNDQIDIAEKRLQDFLFGSGDPRKFTEELDLDMERGGAGWDRRYAETFVQNVARIITQAQQVDFSEIGKSAVSLSGYINHLFRLNLGENDLNNLAQVLFDRLKNKIGFEELARIIDRPKDKGGMGFDKRTSQKIVREIEIILLLRYSA